MRESKIDRGGTDVIVMIKQKAIAPEFSSPYRDPGSGPDDTQRVFEHRTDGHSPGDENLKLSENILRPGRRRR